ncbi:hypothetical protein NDU88_003117 [Pleurodeles waltl]|uniref:Secreted protein n=1 Tax=Pleurodeles waltl TaxID=8319 RepID=A0AAV7LG74_PLEWA|nr:hypothetical protein NDU88_003117 [Pleurodeles waltl]
MADEKVRAALALALLQQAGRVALVRTEALATGRPVRRASAGVAAAVMACSPPRAVASVSKVRGVGRGAGGPGTEGEAWAGRGRAGRRLWELRGLPRGRGVPGLRFGKGERLTA